MKRAVLVVGLIMGLTALSTSAFATAFTVAAGTNVFASGFGSAAGVGDGSGTAPAA
jgi:hypothetical protein